MCRDIVFNEGGLIKDSEAAVDENEKFRSEDRLELEVESSIFKNRTEAADSAGVNEHEEDIVSPQEQSSSQEQFQEYQFTRDRQKRQVKPTKRFGYADLIGYALSAANEIDDEEPKSFKEATQSLFKEEWQRAMEEEWLGTNGYLKSRRV